MSRHEQYEDYDPMEPPSAPFLKPTPSPPRNLPREPKVRRPGRLRRHDRTESQPVQPIYGVPSPAAAARGASDHNPNLLSPPPLHNGRHSPTTEIALLPGGGVEIPAGFRFNVADQGHYRNRAHDLRDEEGGSAQPHVLGGLGFGMFKGLRKIPGAIVKAGRSYGPKNQARQEVNSLPEMQTTHESPIQDDVETYLEQEEEEGPTREELLFREYTRRRRRHQDRAYGHRRRRERDPHYVPAPQPVLVPGARTPAASAAASQAGHSQAGHSDVHSQLLEARLEAQEQEREREALAYAQERERARHKYASEAVKQPSSSVSGSRFLADSPPSHRRRASEPGLPNRVYSRWAAERDEAGHRKENARDDVPSSSGSYSPLSLSNIRRIIQQIRDMPWVGDRVAADYVPGGVRPDQSSRYISSPRSGSSFTSPELYGADMNHVNALRTPGQSWYAPRDDVLVLPAGVAPPPGFVPFPYPIQQGQRGSVDAPSASSHTHVDSHIEAPAPAPAAGPMYVNGDGYHYMPAAASATGQPYIFVPMQDGRHRPVTVPASEAGR